MSRLSFIYILFLLIFLVKSKAQPFVDIAALNNQNFISNYSDSSHNKLYIQDNFFNVFIPKKFGKDHVFLLRFNTEQLIINRYGSSNSSQRLYSLSLPIGFVFTSINKKWKYTGVFIPKINSDFKDDLSHDLQLGGIGLITRVFSDNLQVRIGAYYNREFFGNFFLPLAGVDWKINTRLQVYGTMPSNYRLEYKMSARWNTGFGFRAFTRSFRLSNTYGNDFIRIKENQLKIYLEGFVYKKILLTVDVFRTLGYRLSRNDFSDPKKIDLSLPVFKPFNGNFGFTVGLAYRILTAKPQQAEKIEE